MKISYCFNLLLALILSLPVMAAANDNFLDKPSIEFFASNNTGEIDLQTAFNRLRGEEQQDLQNDTIGIMQKERIEQSKFEDVLGTYEMSDQKVTADNSEKVITSSYQKLSDDLSFKLAKKLANTLKQESVAVFIPDHNSVIGDTILKLKSHPYTIAEIVKMIHDKLPDQYSQAFSLHLTNDSSFDSAVVDEVEWLGSKIDANMIKNSFPQEEVSTLQGKAYLVYKNGQREQL